MKRQKKAAKKTAKKTIKKAAKKTTAKKVYATKKISMKAKSAKKATPLKLKETMPVNPGAAENAANPAEALGHRNVNMVESSFVSQNNSLAQHNLDARQKFTRAARTRVNGASHRRTIVGRGK